MKKRTLNQTWILCLRMWRSIAKEWTEDTGLTVSALKAIWLRDNDFEYFNLKANCFFCGYTLRDIGCDSCPGRLVDPDFDCSSVDYDYNSKPSAFYVELLRLNQIRKAKK